MALKDIWGVFDYECKMAVALSSYLPGGAYTELAWELQNAVIECLILHTRILADILLSKKLGPDDITLDILLPGFTSSHTAALKAAYGDAKTANSPCWQFNKMMAHPTTHRSDSHDYISALQLVWPHMGTILNEVQTARCSVKLM